jgi:hypothetical protein
MNYRKAASAGAVPLQAKSHVDEPCQGTHFPLTGRSRSGSLPKAERRRREAAPCFCWWVLQNSKEGTSHQEASC